MFEFYSNRARQILFVARVESGARGAEMIDVVTKGVLSLRDAGVTQEMVIEAIRKEQI